MAGSFCGLAGRSAIAVAVGTLGSVGIAAIAVAAIPVAAVTAAVTVTVAVVSVAVPGLRRILVEREIAAVKIQRDDCQGRCAGQYATQGNSITNE